MPSERSRPITASQRQMLCAGPPLSWRVEAPLPGHGLVPHGPWADCQSASDWYWSSAGCKLMNAWHAMRSSKLLAVLRLEDDLRIGQLAPFASIQESWVGIRNGRKFSKLDGPGGQLHGLALRSRCFHDMFSLVRCSLGMRSPNWGVIGFRPW